MKRFTGAICVDQGTRVLFDETEDGGPMWQGSGPREVRMFQPFAAPFIDEPAVTVSFAMWDIDQMTNARMDIAAESVGAKGFEIVFRTWGDTHVARVRANWMAIGAAWDDAE
jgi:hypothetical protein